jgi:hypothetical protein
MLKNIEKIFILGIGNIFDYIPLVQPLWPDA